MMKILWLANLREEKTLLLCYIFLNDSRDVVIGFLITVKGIETRRPLFDGD
jgi:hypothetical protein